MKTGKTSRDIMTRKVINMSNTAIPLSFCVFIYLWTKVFDILCTVSLSVNHPGHLQWKTLYYSFSAQIEQLTIKLAHHLKFPATQMYILAVQRNAAKNPWQRTFIIVIWLKTKKLGFINKWLPKNGGYLLEEVAQGGSIVCFLKPKHISMDGSQTCSVSFGKQRT